MAEQKISEEELKELQKRLLKMAKIVKNILEKNHLRYFILGGSFLGAIRHKGFIPWDDDFDFTMPRKDYQKFLKIIENELPKGYSIVHYSKKECKEDNNVRKTLLHSAKVIDLSSFLYTEKNGEILKRNVFIDIIPLDGIPNGKVKQLIHKIKIYIRLICLKISRIQDENYFENGYKGKNILKKSIYKIIKLFHIGRNKDSILELEKFDKTLSENDYEKCDKISNILGGHGLFKETFWKKDIGKGEKYSFEDTSFIGPQNYNEILTKMYGKNYNVIPPKDSPIRLCKHSIKVELNKGEENEDN